MTDQPPTKLSEKMDKLVPFAGEQQAKFERTIAQLRGMVSNGQKLNDQQVVSLAKFAMIEDLHPFTGECYILVDKDGNTKGLMAGIAGARRKAKEALRGGDYFLYFQELKELPAGVEIGYHVTLPRLPNPHAVWRLSSWLSQRRQTQRMPRRNRVDYYAIR